MSDKLPLNSMEKPPRIIIIRLIIFPTEKILRNPVENLTDVQFTKTISMITQAAVSFRISSGGVQLSVSL